jgi:hypothetical protein
MSDTDSIVVQPLAPVLRQEGFNPYFDQRLAYDDRDTTKVVGRWVRGEYFPVSLDHANKSK